MRLSNKLTRRDALKLSMTAAALGAVCPAPFIAHAEPDSRKLRIGACDWSLGKSADPTVFELAKEIGLDGVQVSVGSLSDDLRLRQQNAQQSHLRASRESGVAIASMALGELNNVPYKSDVRTTKWVEDSIDVCKALGTNVLLLAFFAKNDLLDDLAGVDEVVRRLKAVAPKAERAGVVLGIESWLSAQQHLQILDRVGSKAVQVYYDVRNATDRGYNIIQEIRQLGAKRICEIHAKENGALLGQGKVDFAKVRGALDEIGYKGWIIIEGAVPKGADVGESYRANCRFLRQVLGS